MKNRKALGNMAMIDLLHKANAGDTPFCNPYMRCVVRNLSGDRSRDCTQFNSCYDCIAAFLKEDNNNGNVRQ